jgi:hypothetical protein
MSTAGLLHNTAASIWQARDHQQQSQINMALQITHKSKELSDRRSLLLHKTIIIFFFSVTHNNILLFNLLANKLNNKIVCV